MARNVDQLLLKYQRPKTEVVSGSADNRSTGADGMYAGAFRDECFVVADAAGSFPNGHVASKLAGETALWGYKHIRQKRYYWQDKRLFMKRIYRSVNIAVWQKTRETGYGDGLACSLAVVIVGNKNVWIGNVGDTHTFIFREGKLFRQTSADVDEHGHIRKMIGIKRYGLAPQYISVRLKTGDTIVIVTGSVIRRLTEEALAVYVSRNLPTGAACIHLAKEIVAASVHPDQTARIAVTVVRRIVNAEGVQVSHLSTGFQ